MTQIQTQYKLVWLGHYIPDSYYDKLRITHVLSSPIMEIYYSKHPSGFNSVLRPKSAGELPIQDCPIFPVYRTPVPACGIDINQLFYSEAALDGVRRVQCCYDKDRCVGLLLDYKNHSQTVGRFRCDINNSDFFEQPQSIIIIYDDKDQSNPRVCMDVKFSGQKTDEPMSGMIVWWYSASMSDVSIVD